MKSHENWVRLAQRDLEAAEHLLKGRYLSHSCFLCQQCVEKVLKGFLVLRAETYPKSHQLPYLLSLCEEINRAFSKFAEECETLDPYYIPLRYPDMTGISPTAADPNINDAKEALHLAKKVFKFVSEIIKGE
jgi:HEPN domain-containing protein